MKSPIFVPVILVFIAIIRFSNAHSSLIEPIPRGGGNGWASSNKQGINSAACGSIPKERGTPEKVVHKRGDEITVKWPRNNHPGGFIRLALVPFDSPQTHEDFDKNVVLYTCHETDCQSRDLQKQPLGPDDPKYGDNKNLCSQKIKIPDWASDGKYTLQWKWHGGGSFKGDIYKGLVDWFQCTDFTVNGGPSANPASRPKCPIYKPGDIHTRQRASTDAAKFSNKCLYFGKGNLMNQCLTDTGCSGQYEFGVPQPLATMGCLADQSTESVIYTNSTNTGTTTTPSNKAGDTGTPKEPTKGSTPSYSVPSTNPNPVQISPVGSTTPQTETKPPAEYTTPKANSPVQSPSTPPNNPENPASSNPNQRVQKCRSRKTGQESYRFV
ncbi:hypothetical protein BKA69DRAFT_144625 [Paraphysoderma sedebokerense]|nr:hypothetical protein BKA69DRAFT_144625 [Paraphysoderma sedebokerense]